MTRPHELEIGAIINDETFWYSITYSANRYPEARIKELLAVMRKYFERLIADLGEATWWDVDDGGPGAVRAVGLRAMLADLKLAVSAGAEGLQLGVLKGVAAQEYSRDGQQPERQLVQQRHDHSVMI